MTSAQESFYGLGIAPGLLSVIDGLKYTVPTPIQHKAIPSGIEGKDIIGIAQTGTGKTLAFGIPMVQRLASQPQGRGLVLVPTRELALQVNEALVQLVPAFKMKTVVIIGGESMHAQVQRLRASPRIIIATPGRLLDHLSQRLIQLNDISILVLDEADRMLDMGFLPQINRILQLLPRERQTMLFSATMPASIVKIASQHMRLPVRTEIAPSGTAAELVSQELFVVRREMKGQLLGELLKKYHGSVLLFVRTRRAARKAAGVLRQMGHAAAEIHADRSLAQRKDALRGFKTGEYRILVATDIAARGIDVTGTNRYFYLRQSDFLCALHNNRLDGGRRNTVGNHCLTGNHGIHDRLNLGARQSLLRLRQRIGQRLGSFQLKGHFKHLTQDPFLPSLKFSTRLQATASSFAAS